MKLGIIGDERGEAQTKKKKGKRKERRGGKNERKQSGGSDIDVKSL